MQIRLLAALEKTNSQDLKGFVIQSLNSNSSEVRQKARSLAGKAGVPTLSLIIATLNDPKPSGQGEAIKQLAELKSLEAKTHFTKYVNDYKSGKTAPQSHLLSLTVQEQVVPAHQEFSDPEPNQLE